MILTYKTGNNCQRDQKSYTHGNIFQASAEEARFMQSNGFSSVLFISGSCLRGPGKCISKLIHFNQIFKEEIKKTSLVNLKSFSLRRTAYSTRILPNLEASPFRQRCNFIYNSSIVKLSLTVPTFNLNLLIKKS